MEVKKLGGKKEKMKAYRLKIVIRMGESDIPIMDVSLFGYGNKEIEEIKKMHQLQVVDVIENASNLIEGKGQEIIGMSETRRLDYLAETILFHFLAK